MGDKSTWERMWGDWDGIGRGWGVPRERLGGKWVGWGVMGVDMEGLGGH